MSERMREGAYTGPSRMAVPFPSGDDDQGDDVPERSPESDEDSADEQGDDDQGDDDRGDDDRGDGQGGRRAALPSLRPLDAGAGWVLGFLLWGFIGLPFLKGGPARVKQTLMAKFLNKAPDGSWLP